MITIKVSQIVCDPDTTAVITTESRRTARTILDALKFKLHVNQIIVDGKEIVKLGETEAEDEYC